MDRWDGEVAKAGIQMADAARKAAGNVLFCLIDGLIEKRVFTADEVKAMLDRLEATFRHIELQNDDSWDWAEEAEVRVTFAMISDLRIYLFSDSSQFPDGSPTPPSS